MLLTVTNIYLIEQNQSSLCIPFTFNKVLNDLPIKLQTISTLSVLRLLQPMDILDRLFRGIYASSVYDIDLPKGIDSFAATTTDTPKCRKNKRHKKGGGGRSPPPSINTGKSNIMKLIHDHNTQTCKHCKKLVSEMSSTFKNKPHLQRIYCKNVFNKTMVKHLRLLPSFVNIKSSQIVLRNNVIVLSVNVSTFLDIFYRFSSSIDQLSVNKVFKSSKSIGSYLVKPSTDTNVFPNHTSHNIILQNTSLMKLRSHLLRFYRRHREYVDIIFNLFQSVSISNICGSTSTYHNSVSNIHTYRHRMIAAHRMIRKLTHFPTVICRAFDEHNRQTNILLHRESFLTRINVYSNTIKRVKEFVKEMTPFVESLPIFQTLIYKLEVATKENIDKYFAGLAKLLLLLYADFGNK